MGCDIHAHIEYRAYPERGADGIGGGWWGFASLRCEPRNYRLFGALTAGEVRHLSTFDDAIAPRGVPPDMDHDAAEDYYETDQYGNVGDIPEPVADWHSASWLTTAEFRAALNSLEADDVGEYWRAVLASMETLEASGRPARLVFWFDN